ncbi:hypothetical protein I4F81_011967 [Pyropia yezoensis]|uniref:Uncharacterized protein n=1 Tax=Pyropia yezoensis TaxID=2788 RepID=A0ACC3CGU2_PYRYE|nr:hypothetical protein I4F81_011967 [Neopyropia yezoensis]
MASPPPHSTALAVSLFFGGLHAGSLAFVSAVEARTLGRLVSAGETAVLRAFFRIWWPIGRDWMAPLGVAAAAAFCRRHHVRAVLSVGAYVAVLWAFCW